MCGVDTVCPRRFKEALLLDCDVVPMRDPTYMFEAPEFRQSGNYFWGDIYGEGMFKDEAFDYVGRLLLLMKT
jgi:hypothetical protein